MQDLPILQIELAFEQITLVLADGGLHWQFYFGNQHIADYWPASAKGQRIGAIVSCACASAAQAQRLAVHAKHQLFAEIAASWV